MSLFDSVSSLFKNSFDKKKEEREILERVQKETRAQRLQVFEEQLRADSLKVAKAKAMRDAAEMSGLMKLRQVNRVRNLEKPQGEPGSFFEKMRDYTQKNIANREENLKKTAELRNVAQQEKEKKQKLINVRNVGRASGWGKSTWRP